MFSSVFPLSLKNSEMSKTYFIYCIMKVEGVGSSKPAANQNETNVIQLNDRGKEDEQTPCSKLVGKRSAEKGVSELTAYELDGDQSTTKYVMLKCVKIEPKD